MELNRAYRLYSKYQTQTAAYDAIAASLGLTRGQLNTECNRISNERRLARSAAKKAA
jgi:hypothetical protein